MQKIDAKKKFEYHCEKGVNETCPFSKRKCLKLSKVDIGICAFHHNNEHQIICPNYFLKYNVLEQISSKLLNTEKYKIIQEMKINNNFMDYVLVDSNNLLNYCGVEFQALDTTGNYKWLYGEKVKPFCINWKTTMKTIVPQLFIKGSIFKSHNKKIVLVVQSTFLSYLKISNLRNSLDGDIIICSLNNGDLYFYSMFLHDLFSIFDVNNIDLDEIIRKNSQNSNVIDIK